MLFITPLLVLLFGTLVNALPTVSTSELGFTEDKSILPRQIITEGTSVACCTNCGTKYDYATFWHAFDDLCTWAGKGLELWTAQTYYTGSYYCQAGSTTCIHLEIWFGCTNVNGDGEAAAVSYPGCMGNFDYVINPPGTCGGPPYPGAKVTSADGCWVFQATADLPDLNGSMELLQIGCDESGRYCSRPGSNQTMDTYVGPTHQFGHTVEHHF